MNYFIILTLSLSLFAFIKQSGAADANVSKNEKKNDILSIFSIKEFKVQGRVIRDTGNGIVVYDWKDAGDAILEMQEIKERYRNCHRDSDFYIEYDKYIQ
ncbi:MAG: hypothetical protein KGJ58_00630 [Patescibacteria group bacterium]|nr:hypothetical protein [Patescibacteria group bacterium]MDE2217948.1 hypothetical protein [Patescibacteria group bacterium]